MVRRCLLVLVVVARVASADSTKLGQARTAIDAVRYDDAQRLLAEALQEGNNSADAVAEIYKLSATTAVVLGNADTAEQFYRRWLAIDPAATMPADASPKLRDPFVAAQVYMQAHGRLTASVERTSPQDIDVVITDPLGMVASVSLVDEPNARSSFDAAHHARLRTANVAATTAVLLDESNNRLRVFDVPAREPVREAPLPPPPAPPPATDQPPFFERWMTWAVPTALFTAAAGGFAIAAVSRYDLMNTELAKSGNFYLSDVQSARDQARLFTWLGGGALAAAIGFGIPTAVFYSRNPHSFILPTVTNGGAGVSVGGAW